MVTDRTGTRATERRGGAGCPGGASPYRRPWPGQAGGSAGRLASRRHLGVARCGLDSQIAFPADDSRLHWPVIARPTACRRTRPTACRGKQYRAPSRAAEGPLVCQVVARTGTWTCRRPGVVASSWPSVGRGALTAEPTAAAVRWPCRKAGRPRGAPLRCLLLLSALTRGDVRVSLRYTGEGKRSCNCLPSCGATAAGLQDITPKPAACRRRLMTWRRPRERTSAPCGRARVSARADD